MYVTSELLFFNSSLLDKKYNLFLFEVTFPLFGLTRAQLRRFTIVASTDVANSSLHRTGWRRMDEATRETPSGVKRKAVRRRLLLRVTWQSTLELILGRSPTDVIMTGVEKCTLQHIIWRFVSIKIYFCYPCHSVFCFKHCFVVLTKTASTTIPSSKMPWNNATWTQWHVTKFFVWREIPY